MKRGFKVKFSSSALTSALTAGCLAGLMLATTVAPVFAQDYGNNSGNYNQGYQSYGGQQKRAPQNYNQGYNLAPLQGRVTTVPAGSVIRGAAPTEDISSQYLTVGDTVTFTLNQPYYFNNAAVLPAGTMIQGNAIVARKASFAGQYGMLKIAFNNATLPNGQRVPLSGKLATQDHSGLLSGGTTGTRVLHAGEDVAGGAAGGALLGLIGSAVSGGNKGKGTAIMTGVGGGLGLLGSGIQKGKDVTIEAGKPVDIILDQPLTVGGNQSSGYDNNYNY